MSRPSLCVWVDWNSIDRGVQKTYRQVFPNFPWDDFIQ